VTRRDETEEARGVEMVDSNGNKVSQMVGNAFTTDIERERENEKGEDRV